MWGKRRDFYNANGKKPAVGGGGGLFLYVAGTLGSVLVGLHE